MTDVLNRSLYSHLDKVEGHSTEAKQRMTLQNEAHTLRIMMYIFPRQFGLHNVFTSKVNFKETAHRLKDYTLREEEIFEKFGRLNESTTQVKIPKRLRGTAIELIRKVQILHQRCSYSKLLQHHCPVSLQNRINTGSTNFSRSFILLLATKSLSLLKPAPVINLHAKRLC